ncbi:MAG: amidohydrolase family protein [Planctomycetota bacterium]
MIWDLHCHLSGVRGVTPEQRMSELLRYADRVGVERLVVFMGMNWSQDPTPEDLRQQNDEVLQAISHWHDRAFGFVYLSARHVEASLSELERCVANGPMVGVKLWVAKKCDDEQIDPIIRRATELNAVIFQHTWLKADGNYPGESTPMELAEMAKRHPKAKLICGHTGGDWERGIRAVRSQQHVSIGIGGSDPTTGLVEMAVRELGPERILYGSDVGGRSFASQLAKVQGANISERDKRLILGENLKRLLLPILRDKGVRV